METLTLSHRSQADGSGDSADDLRLDQIVAVAYGRLQVAIEPETLALLEARREAVLKAVQADPTRPIYGFNTGFGSNLREAVPDGQPLRDLQANLIRSHAACVGPCVPRAVVRATMLLRARSLIRGHSAISPEAVQLLVRMLNLDIVPAVPRYGTVSASGDLAPLSHIILAMIGEGELLDASDPAGQRTIATGDFLRSAAPGRGYEPIVLGMKEGLALNNGCQYSAAWMALTADRMRRLIQSASLATALTAQVMMGADTPFRSDLHALRPHPGSVKVARWVHDLMQGSPLREFHRDFDIDGEVQDPYNLRCAAQVLGPCLELIERAVRTVEVEANSVTDNPIDLNWPLMAGDSYDAGQIASGGHFHGMPLAVDSYGLLQAAGIMARLSNMRAVRYVDARRNRGLGPQARWPAEPPEGFSEAERGRRATRSGMLLAEYTSAGLTNWIWGQAMPSHMFSLSTDSGQEDHVSMAANVAIRAHEVSERLSEVLAAEMAFASQALAIRQQSAHLRTGPVGPLYDTPDGPRVPGAEKPREVRRMYDEKGRAVLVTLEQQCWRPMASEDIKLSPPSELAIARIRQDFPVVEEDRALAGDLSQLSVAILAGEVSRASGYSFD